MDARSEIGEDILGGTNINLDDDGLDATFLRSQAAAEAAINGRTPSDVLQEYFPPPRSPASTVGTTDSTQTPPTSMSIHNEAAADVSEIATAGTLDNEHLLWGLGSENVPRNSTTKRKTVPPTTQNAVPAFPLLPLWARICVPLLAMGSIVLAVYGLRELLESIHLQIKKVPGPQISQDASFWATYFPRLTQVPVWKGAALSLNGVLWLCSLTFCIHSFRQMLYGRITNRKIQVRLLSLTFLWLVCSGIDGVLRFRTREEVSLSMITILVLMMALSTFSRHLAVPTLDSGI